LAAPPWNLQPKDRPTPHIVCRVHVGPRQAPTVAVFAVGLATAALAPLVVSAVATGSFRKAAGRNRPTETGTISIIIFAMVFVLLRDAVDTLNGFHSSVIRCFALDHPISVRDTDQC